VVVRLIFPIRDIRKQILWNAWVVRARILVRRGTCLNRCCVTFVTVAVVYTGIGLSKRIGARVYGRIYETMVSTGHVGNDVVFGHVHHTTALYEFRQINDRINQMRFLLGNIKQFTARLSCESWYMGQVLCTGEASNMGDMQYKIVLV